MLTARSTTTDKLRQTLSRYVSAPRESMFATGWASLVVTSPTSVTRTSMFATRWGELGRNVTNVSDSYEHVCN